MGIGHRIRHMLLGLSAFFLLLLLVLGGFVYTVWKPSYPALLMTRVHRIAAAHGGFTPLSDIPVSLQRALIATEDRSFYHNSGIDVEGILRALWVDISHGQLVQGGSTITEQLVKDIFLSDQKTIPRKVKQIAFSVLISRYFTKNEILAMYLNEVYLGQGAYGVGDAARVYFGESPTQLTPAQATLLAGLPQAPSLYDPLQHYALAKMRQSEVLQSMVQAGFLTASRARVIARSPLHLVRNSE
ncbi:MAG: transglycosylase domain-containing protein [Firmicutes bacterium]|nr:transglycosylase domain-containing protein [Bacillota bacterium]